MDGYSKIRGYVGQRTGADELDECLTIKLTLRGSVLDNECLVFLLANRKQIQFPRSTFSIGTKVASLGIQVVRNVTLTVTQSHLTNVGDYRFKLATAMINTVTQQSRCPIRRYSGSPRR